MDLDHIIEFASAAHQAQLDAQGRDYVAGHLAPIAAGAAVFGLQAECAAWLHDILEDTSVTEEDLAQLGIDPEVIAAVESVSRREDETYEQLISRACRHPLGRLVKLADNAWNITSNPGLSARDPQRAQTFLTDRYLPARTRLLEAAGLDEGSREIVELQQVLDDCARGDALLQA